MTQDGRLAADPVIGGGSANLKAIELLQSAIAALKECQPYTMLPPIATASGRCSISISRRRILSG